MSACSFCLPVSVSLSLYSISLYVSVSLSSCMRLCLVSLRISLCPQDTVSLSLLPCVHLLSNPTSQEGCCLYRSCAYIRRNLIQLPDTFTFYTLLRVDVMSRKPIIYWVAHGSDYFRTFFRPCLLSPGNAFSFISVHCTLALCAHVPLVTRWQGLNAAAAEIGRPPPKFFCVCVDVFCRVSMRLSVCLVRLFPRL